MDEKAITYRCNNGDVIYHIFHYLKFHLVIINGVEGINNLSKMTFILLVKY